MNITLRPMTDSDLPVFGKWLHTTHVAEWYHEPEDWINEFKARYGKFCFIHHFIVQADGIPIGFCQYYACRDSGEDWNGYQPTDNAYSIDYLIGERAYLRCGCGKRLVNLLLERICLHSDAESIIVMPEAGNISSRGLLLACGFAYDEQRDLFVIKLFQVKPDRTEAFEALAEKMIREQLEQPGCITVSISNAFIP